MLFLKKNGCDPQYVPYVLSKATVNISELYAGKFW